VAGPGEAVIATISGTMNFFDLLMIQGKYQHQGARSRVFAGGEVEDIIERLARGTLPTLKGQVTAR